MRQERRQQLQRIALITLAIAAPLLTACELVYDFDRSPLQPVFEAGVDSGSDSASSSDAPSEVSEGSTPAADANTDSPTTTDAPLSDAPSDVTSDGG